ncbi:MAG: hypothetical protein J7501_10500, partial [Bdellovibrio sp.]|nr:hypothetical protein [Bdellovibrio sp.]
MSLSTEPWFVELFEKCSGDYVGNSDPLREADLISASKKYNISIPRNFENRQVLEFLNWRILSLRASMVPTFRQNKKQPLRLRDYEIYLKSIWASSPSTLKKTLTAITRSYIPYLKNRFSTDASLGVRNISNPWSLRIQLFENPYFSDFQNFCDDPKHQTSWHLLSNLKKLLLHTKSSVRLTRRKKHDTGAPEIEALLNDYLKASTSYTSAKTAASDTRRIIQMANIKNLNELLSTEGQKRIVALEYEGQVGQYAMSRPRICLRWIFETCHASYLPYFSDMSEEKIFDLSSTPEVTLLIERGWSTLSEYKHTNINKLKTLFRLLLRATNIKTKKAFYALRPSDFIIAALQAEHHGNYLQSFRAIYMFRLAFLERLPRSDQWPEYNSQSYKKFCQEIQNTSYFQSTMLGKTFRFSDFEATFSSQGAHWNLFFKELQNFYYRIADLASENNDNTANFSIAPDDFQKAQNFVLNGAYGEKCSRRQSGAFRAPDNNWRSGGLLKKRTYTTDEKRNLEFLAAYAFQAAIACRFANEASRVVFAEDAPRFVTADGPHKLFWWKEKNCYAVLFSKTRKNKVSYLAPLNDSADAIIKRYLQI